MTMQASSPSEIDPVPSSTGTYVLLIEVDGRSEIEIGRTRRRVVFQPGCYCYVGSALGSGGLAARLRRHTSDDKRLHWHIDYLLQHARLFGALVLESHRRKECLWADWIARRAVSRIEGFGASDCRCPSHLFGLGSDSALHTVVEAATSELGALFVSEELITRLPQQI